MGGFRLSTPLHKRSCSAALKGLHSAFPGQKIFISLLSSPTNLLHGTFQGTGQLFPLLGEAFLPQADLVDFPQKVMDVVARGRSGCQESHGQEKVQDGAAAAGRGSFGPARRRRAPFAAFGMGRGWRRRRRRRLLLRHVIGLVGMGPLFVRSGVAAVLAAPLFGPGG